MGEYRLLFSADERDAVKAGYEALRLLQDTRTKSWELWTAVGAALVILRDKVLEVTHAPRPMGKAYNLVFSELLTRFNLIIDGGTRTRLFELLENRLAVEQWRAKHPDQARKLTHPNSVWREWKRAQQSDQSESTQ